MRNLRFDDKKDRQQRMALDPGAAVKEMYDMVVDRFKSLYIPSESLTVDERISPFKGRLRWKVSIQDYFSQLYSIV